MDCNVAENLISVLYDGEEVPQDAIHHIMTCASCRARLQDYAKITTEMRLLAAEGKNESIPSINSRELPSRHNWFVALGRSVRIPRLAVAAFAIVLAIVTVGWVRSTAQNKSVTSFLYELNVAGSTTRNPIEVGHPDTEIYFSDNDGYAWTVDALKIEEKAVTLSLRIKHFTHYLDSDTVRRELEDVTPQEINYIPGQQITITVEGGGAARLKGSVVSREEIPAILAKPAASLLPAPDEIDIQTPVLILDGKQLLAYANAGVRFRCDNKQQCGFWLYVPGQGLFFFSPDALPGGIQGRAFMSQIGFQEEEHFYTLLAATPIMGGEQPRDIWVAHVKDYLPSQHNGDKSDDALISLGQGTLDGKLMPGRSN